MIVIHSETKALAYLISFYFDELFEPIDDEEVLALVVLGDVAGVQPTVGTDGGVCSLWVVEVAGHHLKSKKSISICVSDITCLFK